MALEVVSLGCRLNLSEGESLRAMLPPGEDLVVINSCAVTAEAVRQSRQAIRRARRERPTARLLVTGCAAEVERAMLAAMPEVDGLVANAAKLEPRAYSSSPLAGEDTKAWPRSGLAAVGEGSGVALRHPPRQATLAPLGQAALSSPARGEEQGNSQPRTRAFVAVQTGCDHACTFCVIPQGRGPSRSRKAADVVAEVARHCAGGVKEVVLTGVDLTSWGGDLPGAPRLGALVASILDGVSALPRLRLSSLDGIEIDAQLFALLAGEPRVMPHVHLSLQSGDAIILKRMKRRHSPRDALDLVAALRAHRPEISIGADLIAGFPTEDEAAHGQNLAIIAALNVVHGHIFPYSPRVNTPAARMPQVAAPTIKRRAAELRAAVAEQRHAWLVAHIGQPQTILAERDGTGHAPDFARVQLPEGAVPGQILTLSPKRIIEGMLA